jgi:hypothetical protein
MIPTTNPSAESGDAHLVRKTSRSVIDWVPLRAFYE